MIIPGATHSAVEKFYESWLSGNTKDIETHDVGVSRRDDGLRVLEQLRVQVGTLASIYANRNDAQARNEFDADGAARLHSVLRIPGYIVSNDDFWRYIAIGEMWDLMVWRHGARNDLERSVGKANFGLGDRWDILPKRLWLRGELGYLNGAEDPYVLVRRGGTDFWTSGVIRRLYAGSRPLVRALIQFQYPRDGAFHGQQYRPQTLGLDGIRLLYKRLRHFQAFLSFAVLDDDAAAELIRSLVHDLMPQSLTAD
jgi:hypothetical protein